MNPFISHQDNPSLSISDAARILHVSLDTLRNWDASGKLKAYRTLGSQRRYKLSDVQVLLQVHQTSHPLPQVPHHTHLTPNHRGPWLGAALGIGSIMTLAMFLYIYGYATMIFTAQKQEVISEKSTQFGNGSVIGAQTEVASSPKYEGGEMVLPKNTTEIRVFYPTPFNKAPILTLTAVVTSATDSAQLSKLTQVGVTNVTRNGFTIIRSSPLPIRSTYYWTALSR